ncbi:MAG: hypothetical protein QOF51_271 [Chloroflexota bacterium]|jgi:hypothetical protein|nr:hypothetical protein [Chloroflexota bacterium]
MELDRERDQQAVAALDPAVRAAIAGMLSPQFSTKRLIDALQGWPDGALAYSVALRIAEDAGATDSMARHIIHGQIIPGILRSCGLVRFAGFIHGNPAEDDGYGVPSRWRRL